MGTHNEKNENNKSLIMFILFTLLVVILLIIARRRKRKIDDRTLHEKLENEKNKEKQHEIIKDIVNNEVDKDSIKDSLPEISSKDYHKLSSLQIGKIQYTIPVSLGQFSYSVEDRKLVMPFTLNVPDYKAVLPGDKHTARSVLDNLFPYSDLLAEETVNKKELVEQLFSLTPDYLRYIKTHPDHLSKNGSKGFKILFKRANKKLDVKLVDDFISDFSNALNMYCNYIQYGRCFDTTRSAAEVLFLGYLVYNTFSQDLTTEELGRIVNDNQEISDLKKKACVALLQDNLISFYNEFRIKATRLEEHLRDKIANCSFISGNQGRQSFYDNVYSSKVKIEDAIISDNDHALFTYQTTVDIDAKLIRASVFGGETFDGSSFDFKPLDSVILYDSPGSHPISDQLDLINSTSQKMIDQFKLSLHNRVVVNGSKKGFRVEEVAGQSSYIEFIDARFVGTPNSTHYFKVSDTCYLEYSDALIRISRDSLISLKDNLNILLGSHATEVGNKQYLTAHLLEVGKMSVEMQSIYIDSNFIHHSYLYDVNILSGIIT